MLRKQGEVDSDEAQILFLNTGEGSVREKSKINHKIQKRGLKSISTTEIHANQFSNQSTKKIHARKISQVRKTRPKFDRTENHESGWGDM